MEETPLGILAFKLNEEIVDKVMQFFYRNPERHFPGTTNGGVDQKIKKSTDINVNAGEIPAYEYWLNECLNRYISVFDSLSIVPKLHFSNYNIQRYKVGEGYPSWHFERDRWGVEERQLAYITYLNDCDGGTEFAFQNWICPCVKGLTIFFPADFLFGHRGVIDYNNEKMIATGWVNWSKDATV